MKLRNLLAYREDLVIVLRMLIPTYQQTQSMNPVAKPDTNLCLHCLTVLAYSLYHAPIRFDSYLREGATRGMLTLVDDAVAPSHDRDDGPPRQPMSFRGWRVP